MDLNNILMAHFISKQTLILHGSSGYGKSETIKAFIRKNGFKLLEKRTCYVDPIEVLLPVKNDKDQLVDFWPSRWLKMLTETTENYTLFLDEFNRPASSQTFNMFTELLLDRSINGMKISDTVLIVGACNLESEDTGVVSIPNAVMNRATHILFAPTELEIRTNMRSELAREVIKTLGNIGKIMDKPGVADFRMNACPRQVDSVCALWETGVMNFEELAIVARGRIGLEKGNTLSTAIQAIASKEKFKMPSTVSPKTFERIFECEEQDGLRIEVISLLKDQPKENAENVALYLLRYASPETCRALHGSGFSFMFPKAPTDKNGQPFFNAFKGDTPVTDSNAPWQLIAIYTKKLAEKKV